ncbi:hypothetical protein GTG28_13635 [Vibrio sp. OCN044]|uniref:Glycine zipper domain-containing protein n=1 Tax=Vibrio tetraodonis subsp. pristinus TaxID=2695891 RepID=A0A6L8LZY2_9VIBR|nr:hypothetical protein [Vibrio tetraodonis]MYM60270.1 hypothetical protein [Vibrio tetraodonis subsp. pristinus]
MTRKALISSAILMSLTLSPVALATNDVVAAKSNNPITNSAAMITNEALIKQSENEYIYQFTYKGQSVETTLQKKGQHISYQVYVDGDFLFNQSYKVDDQDKYMPSSQSQKNTLQFEHQLLNEQSVFDGLDYIKSRNATFAHPDKEKYDIDIFEHSVLVGDDFIHVQVGKTASGIIVGAPAWVIGGMVGGSVGAVAASWIGGPPGAATAGVGGALVGAMVGNLLSVVTGEILSEYLRDEDGNIWLVIDPYSEHDDTLRIDEESNWLGIKSYYLRGTKFFKYASIGKFYTENLEITLDHKLPSRPF